MENEKKKEEQNNINLRKEEKKEKIYDNSLKDFEFILNRSKKINKIIEVDNPVKKIDYKYTREELYSDEILYYMTQLNDKINQYKYISSLNKNNQNSNFHIYNLNYNTEIDVRFEYEFFRDEIHNNPKSYNVHDHRKVPFEEDIRHGKKRYQNYEGNKNNYFKKSNYNNKRSISFDKFNKNSFRNNYASDYDKNNDKVIFGEIKEYKGNNHEENYEERDYSMDNAVGTNKRRNKRKEYCSGLTTYDPFRKKKKKTYKEDNY